MTRLIAFAALALAACAGPAPTQAPVPLGAAPALDLAGQPDSSDGRNTAFARSVAKRYGENRPIADITADAAAQGFDCQDMMETSATPDDPIFSCTRSEVVNACADVWFIDLYRGMGEADARTEGRHVRRCMGALPSNP